MKKKITVYDNKLFVFTIEVSKKTISLQENMNSNINFQWVDPSNCRMFDTHNSKQVSKRLYDNV